MRVAKVMEHRRRKQEMNILATPTKIDPIIVARRTLAGEARVKGMDPQDVKRERRIRNRESAIRYRQRRQMEMDQYAETINELQRERDFLRERLSKYEDLSSLTQRCTTIPAI